MKQLILKTLMIVAALVSQPVLAASNGQPTADQQANMVIYRPHDESHINYRISVDGEHLGRLKHNAAIGLQLSVGDHTVVLNDPKKTTLVVTVEPNKVTYVRANIDRKSRVSLAATELSDKMVAQLAATNETVLIN